MPTRKFFERLAAKMKTQRPEQEGEAFRQWARDTNALATVLSGENPNFDRARFLRSAGIVTAADQG